MKTIKLLIKGEMITLNKYISGERASRYAAAGMKKSETERVYWECREQRLEVITTPVWVVFHWHARHKHTDPDNIAFAKKFIFDGLVQAGVLYADTQDWIKGFEDHFYVDKANPRIEVFFKHSRP